jgi:L-ascorbate metabolism protein UlaG (beta-lactamase superfamily)
MVDRGARSRTPARPARRWPADFSDRLTSDLPGFRAVIRMMRERGGAPVDRADAARIPVTRPAPLPPVDATTTAVTWVGHASYVVRMAGVTVLTDPVWSAKIPGVPRRLTPAGVAWEDLPPVDAVVISHNHYDHLDAPTIRRLPRDTQVLVPANLGRWFRRRGFTDVVELDWWESHPVTGRSGGEVRLDFVPSHHWSRRTLTDQCRSLWGGWVLTAGDSRVYFAGDTGYGHFFAEIGARYPGIDLALMPVGAYEPSWFMKAVHCDPDEAVRACADLAAARMATMHWGTFLLSAEPLLHPVERARAAWAAAGRPREHLWDLAVGETRTL